MCPNYTFQDRETEECFNITMSINDRDNFIEENPQLRQCVVMVPTAYRGKIVVPDYFKEKLKKIQKDYPGSTVEVP